MMHSRSAGAGAPGKRARRDTRGSTAAPPHDDSAAAVLLQCGEAMGEASAAGESTAAHPAPRGGVATAAGGRLRSPRACSAGPGATPATRAREGKGRRAGRGWQAEGDDVELQELLPTQLNLSLSSSPPSAPPGHRGSGGGVSAAVAALPGGEWGRASTWSEALAALGSSDVLSVVFNHLDLPSAGRALVVCRAWHAAVTGGSSRFSGASRLSRDMVQLHRLEDRLVLAPRVDPTTDQHAHTLFCSHRRILVDWLVDVQGEYELSTHTLHTAIQLVDRCLQSVPAVATTHIQLVGVTCLFIASKFCETTHPLVRDMVWVCDNSYTLEQHREMEVSVMLLLQFHFYVVTPGCFLAELCRCLGLDEETQMMASYIVDLTLMESVSVGAKPSLIAASSLSLALDALGRHVPLPLVALLSRQGAGDVRRLACLAQGFRRQDYRLVDPAAVPPTGQPTLRAIHDRYAHALRSGVSLRPPRTPAVVRCAADGLCCSLGKQEGGRCVCYWCCREDCCNRMRELGDVTVAECGAQWGNLPGPAGTVASRSS